MATVPVSWSQSRGTLRRPSRRECCCPDRTIRFASAALAADTASRLKSPQRQPTVCRAPAPMTARPITPAAGKRTSNQRLLEGTTRSPLCALGAKSELLARLLPSAALLLETSTSAQVRYACPSHPMATALPRVTYKATRTRLNAAYARGAQVSRTWRFPTRTATPRNSSRHKCWPANLTNCGGSSSRE